MNTTKRVRRTSYETYVAEYNKTASKSKMRYDLMNERAFETIYANAQFKDNKAKRIAWKSRALSGKQAIIIAKEQSKLTGHKITYKDILREGNLLSEIKKGGKIMKLDTNWLQVQQSIAEWS